MRFAWLGHSAVHLEMAGLDLLIDPFWTGNPTFPQGYEDQLAKVDAILLTHGHEDHIGDTVRLAKKYDAVLVGMFEVVQWLAHQGVETVEPMNVGGTIGFRGLQLTMVNALHSSAVIQDGVPVTMGDPAGFVIKGEGHSVYHAGDTDLFSDMALIQRLHEPQLGFLPIGDRFTMGPETAAIAVNELFAFDQVVPIHWGTFDLLSGRPEPFKALVERAEVLSPEPGRMVEI
ncbi:MAG: metal-dependent hydrolase [Geminicoccaceae bacterium]